MKALFDKTFWIALAILAFICWAGSVCYGQQNWFVEPAASYVIPSNSGIKYHGLSGTVDYSNGYAAGLNAGRYVGPFKLYASYNYTSFRAKSLTLQTPFGAVSQADTDLYHAHAVGLFIKYNHRCGVLGLIPTVTLGGGESFGASASPFFELGFGVGRSVCGTDVILDISRRYLFGSQLFGRKSDGSYSIEVEEPNQTLITLSIGKRF